METPPIKVIAPYNCDCPARVVTYEVRRRGYDVVTRPALLYPMTRENYHLFNQVMTIPQSVWLDPNTQAWPDVFPLEDLAELEQICKEDERYHMIYETPFSAHVVTFERYQGQVYAYDPAAGYNAPASEYFYRPLSPTLIYKDLMHNMRYYRVDHCKMFTKIVEMLVMPRNEVPDLRFFSPLKCW